MTAILFVVRTGSPSNALKTTGICYEPVRASTMSGPFLGIADLSSRTAVSIPLDLVFPPFRRESDR
jgi:hypothetical protein